MKTISTNLGLHIQQEVTQLCTLWLVTRRDGVRLGLTDFQADLTFSGQLFHCQSGFTRTAMKATADLAVNNMDVESVFNSALIMERDLRAGLYDYASVTIWVMCWAHPEWGAVIITSGTLGEVTIQDQTFRVELRGLTQSYAQTIGEVTSPLCRADFGDKRCAVVPLTATSAIATVSSQWTFTAGETGNWTNGSVIFTSGSNTGWACELTGAKNGSFNTLLPAPYTLRVGDAFTLYSGCSKTKESCKAYNNIANFRGEPHLPGNDAIFKMPDAPPPPPPNPPPTVTDGLVEQTTTVTTTSSGNVST